MTNITKAAQDALKPCPFCGSSAAQYPDGDMEGHSIMCSGDRLEIGASCPMTAFGYATEAEAAERWNLRTALQDKAGEVRGYEPAGFLLHWPAPGGGRDTLWSMDGAAGHAIGCPVTEIFKATDRAAQPATVVPDGFVLVPVEPDATWAYRVVRQHQPHLDVGCRAWRKEMETMLYWHTAMIAASQQKGDSDAS